jgi:uncharacterized protein YjbI with pentapeptide repeats
LGLRFLRTSLENPKKNWSDYTEEEKEDIKAKLLKKSQGEEVPFKRWSDYTDSEKEQLRTRWTEVEIDLVAIALRNGEELPGFVARMPLSEKDNNLLKELGVTNFDKRIKNYDLRGINLENEDLSNHNLNMINLQGVRLRGANLSKASLIRADLSGADLIHS